MKLINLSFATITSLQQLGRYIRQFAALSLFQEYVFEKLLSGHLFTEMSKTVRPLVQIRLVNLEDVARKHHLGPFSLALAAALEQEREYEQIILSRPTVVLGSQDIGFLPGDQKTKMGPFLQPLMDNLNVIKGQFKPNSREALRIESMLAQEKLIIEPLAYIRGRSLGKCYFIIDEAQNLTPHEVKTIITSPEPSSVRHCADGFRMLPSS